MLLIFSKIERKLRIDGSFDPIGLEHVLFSSNTQNVSETCQNWCSHVQLLSTNGLKNNCMQKLDRVNRPLKEHVDPSPAQTSQTGILVGILVSIF